MPGNTGVLWQKARCAHGQSAPDERLCFTHSARLTRVPAHPGRRELSAGAPPLCLVLEGHPKPIDQIFGAPLFAGIPHGWLGDTVADHSRSMPESSRESVRLRTDDDPGTQYGRAT